MNELRFPKLPQGFKFAVPRVAGGTFAARAEAGGVVLELFDAVGSDAVSATRVAAALRQAGGKPITVQINSPGGDVFEGAAVFNLLRAYAAPVTVQVLGLAASAASVIAMAGGEIQIARNASMLIHRANMVAVGNESVMEEARNILRQIDASMAAVYAERTGQPEAAVRELMAKESLLGAEEAIDLGLADNLLARDALPPPATRDEGGPANVRELEARLRSCGLSKSQAARAASTAWPALSGDDDYSAVAAALRNNIAQLQGRL